MQPKRRRCNPSANGARVKRAERSEGHWQPSSPVRCAAAQLQSTLAHTPTGSTRQRTAESCLHHRIDIGHDNKVLEGRFMVVTAPKSRLTVQNKRRWQNGHAGHVALRRWRLVTSQRLSTSRKSVATSSSLPCYRQHRASRAWACSPGPPAPPLPTSNSFAMHRDATGHRAASRETSHAITKERNSNQTDRETTKGAERGATSKRPGIATSPRYFPSRLAG